MQKSDFLKYLAYIYNDEIFLINTNTNRTEKTNQNKYDLLADDNIIFLSPLNFLYYNDNDLIPANTNISLKFLETHLYFLECLDDLKTFNTEIKTGNIVNVYKFNTLDEFGKIFSNLFNNHKTQIEGFINNKNKYIKFFNRYFFKDYIIYKLQTRTYIAFKKLIFDDLFHKNTINDYDYYITRLPQHVLYISSYRYKHIATNRIINYGLINFFNKKENRNIITSGYPNGTIKTFDINSFEFRIFLQMFNKKTYENIKNNDLYEYFAQKINSDRKKTKLAILSLIYGAGLDRLKELNIDVFKLKELLFEEKTLIKEQLKKYVRKNKIITPFDSVIKKPEKYKIINYIVQSTAADIIFNTLSYIFELKNKTIGMELILNIYDSFIFDINLSEKKLNFANIEQNIHNYINEQISLI